MVRKRLRDFYTKEAVEFLSRVVQDKPLLPFLVPLVVLAWAVERWLVPFSNWVPLAVAVWATIQYGRFQRQQLIEDLNQKWKQLILNTSPMTPLEPCEWLNKLLLEVWPNFMDPMLSRRFSSIVEKRLKYKKPSLLEKIELQEFSLGSCPPILASRGAHWFSSGEKRVLRMGFTWDTNDMSIMLYAKLASPLIGTARIVINSIHIKGDLLLMPILDGQALLYSFESTPEVRVGVVFGSGGSQSLPATELPGVSTWLVKLFTDTLVKMMVEPRRGCFTLPPINLRKKATGCVLSVTEISASKLTGSNSKINNSDSRQNSIENGQFTGDFDDTNLQTFIEVEIEELTRRTNVRQGSSPNWDDSFNMVLHGESGIIRFHLYEWHENGVKFDYLSSCEIKIRYVEDDSTIFWAIGLGSGIIAKRAEYSGKEVQMAIPFEGKNVGELSVKLVVKEWQYSDGSNGLNNFAIVRSQPSVSGSSNSQLWTGRKLKITIMEGRNLLTKSGKCDPYVKIQYGKTTHKTRTISHASNPVWNQNFEFDELGDGEYLKVRCYTADIFGDDNIGSARVNLDGLVEGSVRDAWIPLEKVNTGELRLQMEVIKNEEKEGSRNSIKRVESGWIELVIIEAKDLIAADLRGTSDPYVRVHYGNTKKRTKVVYKTLYPSWNQTLEFPDTGSPMILHVKDYNALLPTSSIGNCVVEYERLPPNQMADKWIPLQGVKSGEIHIQITKKVPELEKKTSLDTSFSGFSKASRISGQLREMIKKLQGSLGDGDLEELSHVLTEVESIEDVQEDYLLQLETEKSLLLNKISELCREIGKSSPSPSKKTHNN